MKKKIIRFLSLIGVFILCTGCSQIRIASDNEWIMKMETSELSKEETKLITLTQSSLFQQFYIPLAGSEFWNQLTSQNQDFETYAKDTIAFEEAVVLTVLNAIADSWELELTEQEEDLVNQASEEYIHTMTNEARSYTGANRKDIIQLISKYARARNVIHLLADDVNMEVSDNEMRVMDIQVILLSDEATALQVKAQIDAGADFLTMANEYSTSNTYEYSVSRGELNEQLEETVFSMDSGTVSSVIPIENEYYIVKCVNDYNETLSAENRENIQQQRIYETWMNTIQDFILERKLELNQRGWNKISMEVKQEAQDAELFTIIEKYFPSVL